MSVQILRGGEGERRRLLGKQGRRNGKRYIINRQTRPRISFKLGSMIST